MTYSSEQVVSRDEFDKFKHQNHLDFISMVILVTVCSCLILLVSFRKK